ncbi:hypothetical protein AM499_15110 [Bacillus sp. FJAT-22090]|uniref:hypothetical protein n=1 Tax=Bacillus sp. FJAT-22090 TaxID=1581038 RepID=UPI0006AED83F|nr:hypothetical protein [Bacillus sp. FJAT-22090]ALC87002.1 hypothetical protein AM499_15110 [Bacillus sp. FJAT-22090]
MKGLLSILICTLLLASCTYSNSNKEKGAEASLEDQMKDAIVEYFGHRVDTPEQAVETIEYNDENGKLKIIVTTFAFMGETLEEFKADILASCILLLQEIQMQDDVQELTLIVEIPYEKENGDSIDYAVYSIDFTKDNLSKINFDELDPQDLRTIADFYFEAPFY